MTDLTLKSIKSAMQSLNLNYGFIIYEANPVTYPYFVGDYVETESFSEDGQQSATFILTGFGRGSGTWSGLESAKAQIENYFGDGRTYTANNGTTVVVMYANSLPVPKEDAELKSIQINLSIKEWKVN